MKLRSILVALLLGLSTFFLGAPLLGVVFAQSQEDIEITSCSIEGTWVGGKTPLLKQSERDLRFRPIWVMKNKTDDSFLPLNTQINWIIRIEATNIRCEPNAQNSVFAKISGAHNSSVLWPDQRLSECTGNQQTKKVFVDNSTLQDYNNKTLNAQIFVEDTSSGNDIVVCNLTFDIEEEEEIESGTEAYDICTTNINPEAEVALNNCTTCFSNGGIWTAVGCIDQEPRFLVAKLIRLGIGIAGGIALLTILASAFSLTISQGQAQKTADAKERLTAAIIGIIFIILSVTILEFIGADILQIPGFGG